MSMNDPSAPCLCDAYACFPLGSSRRRNLIVFTEGLQEPIDPSAFTWTITHQAGKTRAKIKIKKDQFVEFEVECSSGCFHIEFRAYGLAVFADLDLEDRGLEQTNRDVKQTAELRMFLLNAVFKIYVSTILLNL